MIRIGALICCLVLLSCSRIDSIRSPQKTFRIDKVDGTYAYLTGRWRATFQPELVMMIPKVNTVSIECNNREMACTEILAILFTSAEDKIVGNVLTTMKNNYQIVEWSDSLIRAEIKAPVADIELRIALVDKSAERSFRETKARGSDTADPTISRHWVLE